MVRADWYAVRTSADRFWVLRASPRLLNASTVRGQSSPGTSRQILRAARNRASASGYRSVSLHLYSPPIARMGYYDIDEDGRVTRRSRAYAGEFDS